MALGDVASETGLQLLEKKLRAFKKEHNVRFTVVNGENISGSGLTRDQAEALFTAGADVITLGNHTFGKPQIASYLDDEQYILRPANFTGRAPGHGYLRVDLGSVSVAIFPLIGRCDLDFNAENPFFTADKLLKGATAHDASGEQITGTMEAGSGGSSDNNCEAYHITSASATLNFKTGGTVKVWGYGSKKSNYTTTVYAFVGDGYYAGSSYGTPSKTSATFSIASDGTLSGLPSGLTAVDLLVTIGV